MRETINIEPDKSLMEKLGAKNYQLAEALAELVDNSIDEKLPDKMLNVNIILKEDSIVVEDDASGMDKDNLQNALTIAKSDKQRKLGQFGMGLKQSVMHLGGSFKITTSKNNADKKFVFEFDKEKWHKDESANWQEYPINVEYENTKNHYTKIEIKHLRKSIQNVTRATTQLLNDFGERYGPILREVTIKINGREVIPLPIKLDPESKKEFQFYLDPKDEATKVWGWVGLAIDDAGNVKTSNKGYYGFFTFRYNRMITRWDKLRADEDNFAIREHLSHSAIIGEIHMNSVPVENDKRGFIQNSDEYRQVIESVRPYCKELEKLLDEKYKPVATTEEIKLDTEKIAYAAKKALMDEEIKDLADQEENNRYEELIVEKVKQRSETTEMGDVEFRIPLGVNKGSVDPKNNNTREPKNQKKKGPKHTEVEIEVEGGKKINVDIVHVYKYDLPDNRLRAWVYEKDEKKFIVHTNYGAVPRINNFELPAFALNNIGLSLAEFIINSDSFSKIDLLKDKIIVKIGEQLRPLTEVEDE